MLNASLQKKICVNSAPTGLFPLMLYENNLTEGHDFTQMFERSSMQFYVCVHAFMCVCMSVRAPTYREVALRATFIILQLNYNFCNFHKVIAVYISQPEKNPHYIETQSLF